MTNLRHALTSGQSLSIGTSGTPGLSLATEAANARKVDPTTGALSELKLNGTASPQRPDVTMGYRIAQATPAQVHGFSTHGQGGQTIAALGKGGSTGKYEEAIGCVTAAHQAHGPDGYTVTALHWIHGEADQQVGTSQAAYLAALADLQADYTADVNAITGQSGLLPVVMSQVSSWAHYAGGARIGLAQLAAARTLPGFYAVPQYQLPYVSDGLHLTNVGYYRLGELHARAHLAALAGGWAPFAPTAVDRAGSTLLLTYAPPTGGLEFDTTTVPAQPHMGFSVAGTAAEITAVAISAPTQVTLTLTQPVTEPGATVGYGVATASPNGSGLGNLTDGQTATSGYDGTRLANWALHSVDDIIPAGPAPVGGLWVTSAAYAFTAAGMVSLTGEV